MLLFLVTLGAFSLSIAAKVLVDHFLSGRLAILGALVGFERSVNAGVAFGITFPGYWQQILVITALLIIVILAVRAKDATLQRVAFGLILGGAFANIADRLRDGLVTDFIQVGSFPIFNVADSCITIGVVLLLIDTLLLERQRR